MAMGLVKVQIGGASMAQARWQIRQVSTAEMDLFRQIRLEALQCEPDAFASVHADWLKFSNEEWNARMNIPIFVAFVEDKPIGLMALKQFTPSKMMHRATLTMVYVNKSFRGSGLAGQLLEAVIIYAKSKKIAQIELGVRGDRKPAIRFYTSAAFSEIGNVPNGYVDSNSAFDEVLMVRQLNATRC